jgi:putative oxidoreductase
MTDTMTAGGIWRLRHWFVTLRDWAGLIRMSLFQLALRVGVAMVFFNSGMIKLRTWEFTIRLFAEEYKVPVLSPEVAASIAAFCEVTFSSLIIVGLAARLATLPLLGMLAVIQIFVYPDSWPDTLFWGGALIFVLSRGPGVFSIDYLIERGLRATAPAKRIDQGMAHKA